ncbi:MAG TPA: hypothetical protein VE978_23275 [Chitinophagales bacterium]|nr:hypothetical protein [Chitinophagales bacterium]
MRFLKLCFVLMVFGISAKAQESLKCFYHISFGPWEWNYCYGRDTISRAIPNENYLKDTVVIDTTNHPKYFYLRARDKISFNNVGLKVTSMDGKINYEVKSFSIFPARKFEKAKSVECIGAYLNEDALKIFDHAKKSPIIWLEDIVIIDPNLHKEATIPAIMIFVE